MNILFIHQNFPGQFKNLAPALAQLGHKCVALTLRVKEKSVWRGVELRPYAITRKPGSGVHPWLIDFNTKLHRAEACLLAAQALAAEGFTPDVIVAHPGWGESLFLRDLWPKARIGLYYELFYNAEASDTGFDPEFEPRDPGFGVQRIRMKNLNNYLHYPLGDLGICPTAFQAASFPEAFRDRISVIHDGIDTDQVAPNDTATFALADGGALTRQDEVVTFVNRNLEPYRGFHIFMRALPDLLEKRPQAQVVIVGGQGQSYGPAPTDGKSWKARFIEEVRPRIADQDWARVHFVGRIPYPQFLSLMQVSRVHVYLTYPFVLSWSLLEAMSCGAAIVASNTDPVKEVIAHDDTGRLVDFFDPEALAREVDDLLQDHAARQALGVNARALIKAQYDLKRICLPQQIAWIDRLASMEAGDASLFP